MSGFRRVRHLLYRLRSLGPAPAERESHFSSDSQRLWEVKTSIAHIPIDAMGERPSYRYKLEEMKRRRRLLKEEYGLRDPIFAINDKYGAYEFADGHGVAHPLVLRVYDSVDQVIWNELPDAFVLKSRWGSSNTGVKALVRQADGTYVDLLRSSVMSVPEIEDDYREKCDRGTVSRSMFAEELILKQGEPAIADDWKFYCFNGRVGLSMQRDVRGSPNQADWRFKFRDRQWNDLGPVKFVERIDTGLPMPSDPTGLIDLAEKLSALIGRAFIRVDLFESDRGPLLGEFTPAPGPPEVFAAEIDAMLGELWEHAEMELFARSIEAGDWTHLDHFDTEGE